MSQKGCDLPEVRGACSGLILDQGQGVLCIILGTLGLYLLWWLGSPSVYLQECAGKESFITLCGFEQAKQEKSLNEGELD